MHFYTILLLAVALSMDAFAVSVSSGVTMRTLKVQHAARMAWWFGSFQAIMPLIGWLIGKELLKWVEQVDHWIAFGLLGFIGAKMIYESQKLPPEEKTIAQFKTRTLFILAIATSIDALAVGLSLSILKVSIIMPVLIIGLVTYILCFIGVLIGEKIGHFFEEKIEIAGGVILIIIGIKILYEHLTA
jgi:manganese efflux pump family protein